MPNMTIAVVQTNPVFGAKQDNIRQAIDLMRSAPADLYVLPELFATGYNFISTEEVRSLAEPFKEGVTFKALKDFVDGANCHVVYGFAEGNQGLIFNSAGLIGPRGFAGLYRKIHLFDREKLFFAPGDLGFHVFETRLGRIGVMICFDWYFPESARTLALKGAQLIAHPSNLVLPHCPDSMPVRCRENRVFAATANRVGVEERGGHRLKYIGNSQIVSPRGAIMSRCSADEGEMLVEEIDLSLSDDKRLNEHNHLLDDRRPSFYV
jgi:predicted amidohydrolase